MTPLSLAFTMTPRSLVRQFDAACARLDSAQFASALRSRRPDVWTIDPAARQLIANRLGWLTVLDFVSAAEMSQFERVARQLAVVN